MPAKKLTRTLLTTPVKARVKYFDTECAGLYASISPTSTTFAFKFYDKDANKQRTLPLAIYNPDTFNEAHARLEVAKLKVDLKRGIDIADRKLLNDRQARVVGTTFNDVADAYEAHLQTNERKPDGAMRAVKESWRNDVSYLKHARAAFGKRPIGLVTDDDIAGLLDELVKQKYKGLPVNVRLCLHALFKWAGRPRKEGKFVTANPVSNVPAPIERFAKTRALDADEIKKLWHGLDGPYAPCDRRAALAYKLILCTAMRPGEIASALRGEIKATKNAGRCYHLPLERSKNRLPNVQPLNSLACGIVDELLAMESKSGALFSAGANGAAFDRMELSRLLRCDPVKGREGICKALGIAKFTPHDLRRSAANLLKYTGGVEQAKISAALDHADPTAAKVTGVYTPHDAAAAAPLKRPTLDVLDSLLREIVGKAPTTNVVKLRAA